MAVNKNFVIKNGLEVDESLIFAQNEKVGIGSTLPTTTLDIKGQGLRSQDGLFTGILTAQSDFNVGASGTVIRADVDTGFVGINQINPEYPLHIVAGTAGTGVFISGTIVADNIGTGASLDVGDINATGISTVNELVVTGVATFQNNVEIEGLTTISSDVVINNGSLTVTSIGATDILVSGALTANAANIYNQFDVSNNGAVAFQYASTGAGFTQNIDNPTLYVTRGQKYHFNINASGHPFYFKTQQGSGTADQYTNGVEGNGTDVGIVTFVPPFDGPDSLFYQCSNHSGMFGTVFLLKESTGGGGGGGGGDVGVFSGGTLIGYAITEFNFSGAGGLSLEITKAGDRANIIYTAPEDDIIGVNSLSVLENGTFLGSGITAFNFQTTTGTGLDVTPPSAGIASVLISPSVGLRNSGTMIGAAGTVIDIRNTGSYSVDSGIFDVTIGFVTTAGFSTASGISTTATNVIGGIASVTSLDVSGISSLAGIATFTTDGVFVTGIVTATGAVLGNEFRLGTGVGTTVIEDNASLRPFEIYAVEELTGNITQGNAGAGYQSGRSVLASAGAGSTVEWVGIASIISGVSSVGIQSEGALIGFAQTINFRAGLAVTFIQDGIIDVSAGGGGGANYYNYVTLSTGSTNYGTMIQNYTTAADTDDIDISTTDVYASWNTSGIATLGIDSNGFLIYYI